MTELFFDGRFIKTDQPDGISRFSLSLIAELKHLVELTVITSSKEQRELVGGGVKNVTLWPATSLLEPFTALKLNSLGAKVVFSPMQTTSSLGKRFKLILTLHDLIYYRHNTPPKEFNPLIRVIWYLYHLSFWPQRLVLNRADAVVTISETSKRAIEKNRLTKRPITVISNASNPVTPGANGRHSKTLIYMGSFMPYKNVETLIRAMALIPDYELLLLSKISSQRQKELAALDSNGQVRFLGGVTEHDYQELLKSSHALVSASLDEGFGIPIVEAMSHGTPVVLSDIEIFKEVAGDAGYFFAKHDPDSFAQAILRLGESWEEGSKKALGAAERFSWASSAQNLVKLVQSLT
jgi:glycosyltransferase involved in cell wall biosynthesis